MNKNMNMMCLVSDQQMPNFLPILNEDLHPASVTLVVSSKKKLHADWLEAEIRKHQVKVLPRIDLGDEISHVGVLENKFIAWNEDNQDLMSRSVLNVTGGTKAMAIAAQEVFRMAGRPVFYVDIATDSVSWVEPREPDAIKPLRQATLSQLFALNGLRVESGDFKSSVENERWRDFSQTIVDNCASWSQALGELNSIASEVVKRYESARNRHDKAESLKWKSEWNGKSVACWNDVVEALSCNELIQSRNGERFFASEKAARFCNGIWLEHYVFKVLKKMGLDKRQALLNVEIIDSKGNRNELDSVVLYHNTCYVIEDKTQNMAIRSCRDRNVADNAVYKLAQLTSRIGLRTKGILVSARAVRPVDRDRARAYNVEIIDRLSDVESELRRIIGM